VSYEGQRDGGSLVPMTDRFIRKLLAHARALLDGVRGGTLKSAEHHHVGGNVWNTRFCFCAGDRCEGR
jgi:hypothetical protein